MKRLRHALILVLPLLLLVGGAGPAAGTTSRNAVEIQRDVQFDLVGSEA
ncbi:MAG: hypothetical protein F6K28_01900 [Microcoleus sp. SIO2G3]|nr:hypothetical protein [Microcoleus sp. SIO2G3]